jgi:hypothetical protein
MQNISNPELRHRIRGSEAEGWKEQGGRQYKTGLFLHVLSLGSTPQATFNR